MTGQQKTSGTWALYQGSIIEAARWCDGRVLRAVSAMEFATAYRARKLAEEGYRLAEITTRWAKHRLPADDPGRLADLEEIVTWEHRVADLKEHDP